MRLLLSTGLINIFLLISAHAFSQATIELGPDEIAENQAFTITITVKNERLKSYSDFPEIQGFRKRGTSSSSSTNIVNGQITSSQSVTMTYMPVGQGIFKLPSFTMTVNGEQVSAPGKTIKVGPPAKNRRNPSNFNRSPFDDFFGEEESEFVEVEDDAFLALTTSKNEVFVGEGFNTTLSFFVAEDNRAPLQFHQLGQQLAEILKKLRPANSWEENFNIENVNGETIILNGKRYTQYKIYQATFFPLNNEDVTFPSVDLRMIKYKVAKNPSFFGRNRQEDFKSFSSKPKTVKVKDLPPHPLKDIIQVGNYRLDEEISSEQLETGNSFTYRFSILGEGNIAAIDNPNINFGNNFDFYDPNVNQKIYRQNGKVTGTKSFNYYAIPKEPGTYDLGEKFRWIFFNPKKEEYDTLRSNITVNVTGESKKNEAIQANDLGSFYDIIEVENNELERVGQSPWLNMGINIFILLLIGASFFIIFKKP
ncbi:MAG: BatD family protein [Candidatus Cyclobacteriaceae bacterium M2_1C_046]